MQKSGGVAIPMKSNKSIVRYMVGTENIANSMKTVPALEPFNHSVVDYLHRVSERLLKDRQAKQYPDVISFGFWCRKASIAAMKKKYNGNISNRLGRGIAFHIAPSNVAVNYAFSLAVGLLAGNANIIRVSSKDFAQVNIINKAIEESLDEEIRKYICIIQYQHNKEITDSISDLCDTRIIWGGDKTISTIRQSPIKARATEITFSDRYSLCIINADEYLLERNKKSIAQHFFNDTYLTDQNACTSPRLIAWTGEAVDTAQRIFWDELNNVVREKYVLQPVQSVSKYTNLCLHGSKDESIRLIHGGDNYAYRVKIDAVSEGLMDYKGNSGYFFEIEIKSIAELAPLFDSGCQTISYYGENPKEIQDYILSSRPRGVDRIAPIGKTMDFSLEWDGYDLINSLTRVVVQI